MELFIKKSPIAYVIFSMIVLTILAIMGLWIPNVIGFNTADEVWGLLFVII